MALTGARGTVSIIDKATKPLRSIAKAFSNMGKTSKIANTDLSKTQKAINGLTTAQNRLGRTQANIKRNTRDVGSQAVGVVAMGLAFKQALNPAIKFEQSMKNLESVAFGSADATVDVTANMKLLSDQAKELGATTSFSATQAAEGQLYLAKAGFKTNDILASMGPLLSLAAASETDLGRASDITSDLLGAFGMKAQDTGKLADVLAAATSSANVDMETLFETLKVAAPIGIAAGQSMEGITSATALLGNVGIKGSMAGTALKNAFTNLAAPAASGSKVLAELGVKVSDSAGNMLPMQDIMIKLGKAAKGLSQTQRIKAFDAVFGKIAMAGAINLEKAVNSGDFAKMLTNLQNSEGVAKKMAKIRMDSTEGSLIQLMSATEGIAISFGTILTPALRALAEGITSFSEPMQNFIKNNQDVIKAVGIVAGVFLVAKVAALAWTASLWLISPALTAMKAALVIAKVSMVAFNFIMTANPIGLIVTAIGLLVGGLVLAYNKLDWFREGVNEAWEGVKSIFSGGAEYLSNLMTSPIETITNYWTELFNWLGSKFEWMGSALDKVKSIGSSISGFFGGSDDESEEPTVTRRRQRNTFTEPQAALQQVQGNNVNNSQANVYLNVVGGEIKSTRVEGNMKQNVFLNKGVQD